MSCERKIDNCIKERRRKYEKAKTKRKVKLIG